jgi:hypothetical protein
MSEDIKPSALTEVVHPARGRMAETPVSVTPSRLVIKPGDRLKKTKYLGFLLFRAMESELTVEQLSFIAHFQAKLDLEQVQRALEFARKLERSPRLRARISADRRRIPTLKTVRPPEKRRIGVGYRDKGTLRPLHKRGRALGSRSFWPGDFLVHLVPDPSELPAELVTHWELVKLIAKENQCNTHLAELALRTVVLSDPLRNRLAPPVQNSATGKRKTI